MLMKIIAALVFLCTCSGSHFALRAKALDIPTSTFSSPGFIEKPKNGETKELSRGSLTSDMLSKTEFTRRLRLQCSIQQLGNVINGGSPHDWFGYSVSLSADGRTLAIGAKTDQLYDLRGYVRVYSYNDGIHWRQLGDDIESEATNDSFGTSVALSNDGRTVAIGAPWEKRDGTSGGHVRVYGYSDGAGWMQLGGDIDGEEEGDESGKSLSLSEDGRTVAIGAEENRNFRGHVRVYDFIDGTGWVQLGDDIDGESPFDLSYKVSLSFDGRTVAIGNDSEHVRVLSYINGTGWTQLGDDIYGEAAGDRSGWSVSLSADGRTVAIGAPFNDGNGNESGHVRVFSYDDGTGWTQLGDDIDGEASVDQSGWSVALSADGRTLVIGAASNRENGDDSGHVRILSFNDGTSWMQLGDDIDGEAAGDRSGQSVALSADGRTVAVGAPLHDGNRGVNSGQVRVYSLDDCFEAMASSSSPTASPTPSIPTAAPTSPPTTTPTSSPNTSTAPTESPTEPGLPVRARYSGLMLEFVHVSKLNQAEIRNFEELTGDWYEGSFEDRATQRQLRSMTTNVTVTGQDLIADEDVNIITYDQTIDYVALENALPPDEYIQQPFWDADKNREYGALLSGSIDAFRLVETPISAPKFPDRGQPDRLSTGAIVGIALGAAALCVGVVFGSLKWRKVRSRNGNKDGMLSDLQPAAHPLPPTDETQSNESQVNAAEVGYSPTYKDSGQSVLGESRAPIFAEAVVVGDENP